MNVYLQKLSQHCCNDYILLAVDRASWHRAKSLVIPDNIRIFYLPACTPEMNPMEQVWKEIRKLGFHNEIFTSLDLVVDKLCHTIRSLSPATIMSITGRDWILSLF